jgi:hypothetical protein
MSGVFQNMDPPPPHRPASVYPPPVVRGEESTHSLGGRGEILEDARHSSTYISTLSVRQDLTILPISQLINYYSL